MSHVPLTISNDGPKTSLGAPIKTAEANGLLHPAWRAFIRYCAELQHGEIEVLKIQDGLPVLAEVVKKKIKFAP